MIICLESSVLGGYLSNEVPGLVTGALYLAGRKEPMRIELVGNFLRDIAGCRVDFHNPLPQADLSKVTALSSTQTGFAGVMTASYRVAKLPRRRHAAVGGSPLPDPQGLKNLIFFEWFNQEGQRLLIQSWHLQPRVSAPVWQLSQEGESALLRQSRARRKHYLLTQRRGKSATDALHAPGMADPFEPHDLSGNPFELLEAPEVKIPAKRNQPKQPDPVQRSLALVQELRRFEKLLVFKDDVRSRPAVLRLLSTVADLATHLIHVLQPYSEATQTNWEFLVVDLEQSLPLFSAALNATDKMMQHALEGTDQQWLSSVQACLLNIELRMRELLTRLR